jgi:hypothetical protein
LRRVIISAMAAIIIKTARGMGRRRRMRIDFGGNARPQVEERRAFQS